MCSWVVQKYLCYEKQRWELWWEVRVSSEGFLLVRFKVTSFNLPKMPQGSLLKTSAGFEGSGSASLIPSVYVFGLGFVSLGSWGLWAAQAWQISPHLPKTQPRKTEDPPQPNSAPSLSSPWSCGLYFKSWSPGAAWGMRTADKPDIIDFMGSIQWIYFLQEGCTCICCPQSI